MKYGVTRNGEHTKLFDTIEEARAQIEIDRAETQRFAQVGWIDQRAADETHFNIERVKRMSW
jgi:hypothetical protein